MEDLGARFDPDEFVSDDDFTAPVAAIKSPAVRVIPYGIVGDTSKPSTLRLRMTLVILPDASVGEDALHDWPNYVEGLLDKAQFKLWIGDGAIDAVQASASATGYEIDPLDAVNSGTSSLRSRLWRELMYPKIKHQYNRALGLVAASVPGAAGAARGPIDWMAALLDKEARPRLGAFRLQRPGPGVTAATTSGGVSTVSAGLGQLDGVLKLAAELEHARGLRRAADAIMRRSRRKGRVNAQATALAHALRQAIDDHIPATETLIGLTDLLRFSTSPQHPGLSIAGASDDDQRRDHAKRMIGGYGLAAARARIEKRKKRVGFDRELPAGPLEEHIPKSLSDAIDRVWEYSASLGQRSRNPTGRTQSVSGPDAWAATTKQILENALNPGLAAAGPPPLSDPANLIARYLLAHRPEPSFESPAYLDDADITATRWHVMKRALADVETRRVYGLLAYPAVARVLRLVQDVEVPLSPDMIRQIGWGASQQPTFWAAASFGGASGAAGKLWTPCRLDGAACVALSRSEVGTSPAVGSHWRGMANLAEKTGGADRYTLTSRHVMAAVEQLINKARGTESAARSGGSAAGRAEATHRTGGITLIDNGREAALQDEVDKADAQSASQQGGIATPIYLEDLSVGYRVDARVEARNKPGDAQVWRSLMGREITFDPVRDSRGLIDVEELVEQTLAACAPLRADLRRDTVAFRRALDEASIRPATRQIRTTPKPRPGDEIDLGQLAPQEGVFQWHGDPLGLSCGTETLAPQPGDGPSGGLDTRADLALPATFGPPRGPVARPPRIELQRAYAFRARHAMLGGGGIGPDQADRVMADPAVSIVSKTHLHMRHERVSAPHVAMLSSARRKGPGETLDTMVIRSTDTRGGKDISRRIIWPAGLPMADTAAHPDLARAGKRVLDALPLAGKRPLGGLVNVMIDPETGGLPTDRGHGPVFPKPGDAHDETGGEGVFVVRSSSSDDLTSRVAHYYPDPAVTSLMVEIAPHSATEAPLQMSVDLYNSRYRQDVDGGVDSRGWRRCEYPFAMPVLIETISDPDPVASRDRVEPRFGTAAPEVGTLDDRGRFVPLQPNRTPPGGSVTVSRVRVLLPPGCDAKLSCWGMVPAERRGWFADYVSATEKIRQNVSAFLPPMAAAVRFDAMLEDTALPQLAEVTDLSLVHAVKRPDAPVLPNKALDLLRLNYSAKEWAELGAAPPALPDQHDWAPRNLGVATAWVGGPLDVDGPDTSEISLSVAWRQADDIPGKPIKVDRQNAPQFPLSIPAIVKVPVERASLPERTVRIDMLKDGVKARGIALPLPDSRAYCLHVTPTAKSTFIRYFSDGNLEERFVAAGAPCVFWALATRRPDSMGSIEMLPVFVWEEIGGDILARTMTVRLSWRRAQEVPGSDATLQDTSQLWYSSGWREKLALIFDCGKPLGAAERFTTQWGADPIRDSRARPAMETPITSFGPMRGAPEFAGKHWLPYPGTSDDGEQPPTKAEDFAARVDLLALDPCYDPTIDAWYADVRIDAPAMANMWLRLGLARYQEYALTNSSDPQRDMHVSRPTTVQFELKPRRTVMARALPREPGSKTWPVLIEVLGPLGSVNGPPRGDDGRVLDTVPQTLGTFFTVEVRRHRAPVFDFGDSFHETIYRASTDPGATPDGDLLCRMIVDLDEKPWSRKHSVLIVERDRMLSANEDMGPMIEDSGPTFMAEIQIRRPRN